MQVVTALMEKTYAFRRGDIMTNSASVKEVLEQYPFLQNADKVRTYIDDDECNGGVMTISVTYIHV